jgi:hypothetical protein
MSSKSKVAARLRRIPLLAAIVAASLVGAGKSSAQQDRYTLTAPNGVAFSEFRGYETWQTVAVSQTKEGIKVIVANDAMIIAYRAGVPGNGKPFPEGSMIAKIEWTQYENPESPYFVNVPGALKSVSFIEKDSKRFTDTNGWGYAQFQHDQESDTFKPFGTDASFNKQLCHACHTTVSAKDYIFTGYAKR